MAYSHPRAQAFLLGCVLFLTVGTYNVITFLGGAGQQTAYLSDGEHLPNLVCYAFDGSSKLYISMGFEFPLVVASILPTQVRCGVSTIPVTLVLSSLAGKKNPYIPLQLYREKNFHRWLINRLLTSCPRCWCGLSAAMLWCAEGTAMMAFASEDKKGLSVSIMWSIFQSGVVIGSAIPVGQNWNAGTDNNSRVNDGTYIGLMILILFGAVLALVLYPWQKMIREDGSKVLVERHLSFFQELASSWYVFKNL
jgi:MFS family permease